MQWMVVQIVGDTLRLPIADESNWYKPFGLATIEREVESVVVNPFSDRPKKFEPQRGECGMVPSFTEPSTLHDCQEFCCSKCGEYMVLQQLGEPKDNPNYCPYCGRKVI